MATQTVRAREKGSLAQFLGWFSLSLGSAQLIAPRQMARLVGASGDGASHRLMRMIGGRELAQGVGILARPRPSAWLWSRVVGDAIDLSLLALTAVRNRDGRARASIAIASVATVTVADVVESRELSGRTGQPQKGKLVRKAVTINRPRQEVERQWEQAELRAKVERRGARVSLTEAPAGQGAELAVELVEAPPVGDLGAAALRLIGKDLPTQLSDDLRRFKQLLEAGEVVRSESTPEGHRLPRHLRQRPAQPLAEVAR